MDKINIRVLTKELGQDYKWNWQRMPEREHKGTPTSKALLGHPVRIKRLVARVGYWLSYHDMPLHQMKGRVITRAYEILTAAGMPREQVYQALHYMDETKILKELQDEAMLAMRSDPETEKFAWLHVPWYFELEEPIWFSPQSIVFKYNGSYSPAWRSAECSYDQEPPSLDPWLRQGYYKGQLEYGYSAATLIHPEDILEQLRQEYNAVLRGG